MDSLIIVIIILFLVGTLSYIRHPKRQDSLANFVLKP